MLVRDRIITFSCALLLILISMNGCYADKKNGVINMRLSKESILQIANIESVRLGYAIHNMIVDVDESNTAWNKYISNGFFLQSNPVLRDKLKDRVFWAIYYAPKEKQFGGDLWIFVDAKNGEIITRIKGK